MPPLSDRRRALGQRGEDIALEHLGALGAALVARNQRTRFGEIDLIVRDGDALVFVEVKTRRARRSPLSSAAGPPPNEPLLGLRAAQRRRLRRLAVAWLVEHPATTRPGQLRFDAIGVLLDERGQLVRLDHLEGAL